MSIRKNALTALPDALYDLTQLRVLSVGDNQITDISPKIGMLKALTHLFIDTNPLTTIPEAIGDLIHLHTLDIAHCAFTDLPASLQNLTQLVF
ncbi:MAG TPA: leucine-rich repeat domain-containing protein, partial [Aggregatilineales bacterium]|nr:leucine-rich repeat domain-containing protein [Aggregatilineales bacterium]